MNKKHIVQLLSGNINLLNVKKSIFVKTLLNWENKKNDKNGTYDFIRLFVLPLLLSKLKAVMINFRCYIKCNETNFRCYTECNQTYFILKN